MRAGFFTSRGARKCSDSVTSLIIAWLSCLTLLFGTGLLNAQSNTTFNANESGLADATKKGPARTVSDKTGQRKVWKGVLLAPENVTDAVVSKLHSQHHQVVLRIDQSDKQSIAAAQRIIKHQKQVEYFFEIGRSPELAKAHPEWMSSLQGHQEWRRHFKDFPKPKKNEVVKNYPWVPIFYKEVQDAQLKRLEKMLADLPGPSRIWLNNIQGGPSACGCGHTLCRWTGDYGPIKTATSLGDAAPAQFVKSVKKLVGDVPVVPILVGECEKEDQHEECGGVGCFEGICWKAFARQLDLLSKDSTQIGAACFYKAFGRDRKRYGQSGSWVKFTLDSFTTMPPQRGGVGVKQNRLMAVIQGWDVESELIALQTEFAEKQGVGGILIAKTKLDQKWTPKLYDLTTKKLKE